MPDVLVTPNSGAEPSGTIQTEEDTMLIGFEPSQLRNLVEDESTPKASVFFPLHRPGEPHTPDFVVARRLISEASRLADAFGDPLTASLNEAEAQLDDYVRHPPRALAILASPSAALVQPIPYRLDEEVIVEAAFQLTPLVPLVNRRPMHVLTITRDQVAWYRGDRWGLTGEDLPNAPAGIDEFAAYLDPEKQLQVHSAGPVLTGFHGHEVRDDHDLVARYLKAVLDAVLHAPEVDGGPVIAIAPPALASTLKDLAPNRLDLSTITANPIRLGADTLHAMATESLDQKRPATIDVPGLDDIADVVAAASLGRVDKLRIRPDARIWGVLHDGVVTVETCRDHDAEELVNRAAIETWRHGGSVYDDPRIPAPALATLRY